MASSVATDAGGNKKPRVEKAAAGGAGKVGPAGPLTLRFVGGEGAKCKGAMADGSFSEVFSDGRAVRIADLKRLCRSTFGKKHQHAISALFDSASGKPVSRPGDLRDGMTLRVTYRIALGCPQPMSVLLKGHRRGFGFGGFGRRRGFGCAW